MATREPASSQVVAGFALLTAAAIWGFTFPLVKNALDDVPTFEFLAIRFAIATVVLAAIFPRSARKAMLTGRRAGLLAGVLLALGHAFQTLGLERTLSTNAGFITGLYVVFTPVIAAVALRRLPHVAAIVGVVLTTTGLALMSLQIVGGRPSLGTGDLLVLVCAVLYAGQIVTLARYASEFDPIALTIQQLGVTALFFIMTAPFERLEPPTGSDVWVALLATALGSSVYGISVQTWAQRRIPPTRAAVIFSMEAPFAALAAFLLADERLTSRAWLGAALILSGMLIVELRPARPDEQEG